MNPSIQSEKTDVERFDEMYPETGPPLPPRLYFGDWGPAKVISLLPPEQRAFHSGRDPVLWTLDDPVREVHIDFVEEAGSELVAYVTAKGVRMQGEEVVIALQAKKQLKFIQRTVALVLRDGHCAGRFSFGSLDEIKAKLGEDILPCACYYKPRTAVTDAGKS